jgi:hypothetical protein
MALPKHKTPDLGALYRRQMREMPAVWNWRLLRQRPGQPSLDLSAYVTSIEWGDGSTVGDGTVELTKADPERNWQPLTKGDLIRVDTEYRGRWFQLVTMRVDTFPESDTGAGGLSVQIKDDLALLTMQKRDWRYRKTKQRGRGWYPGEIARDVAKREGLRVGHIHRGYHRIDKLEKKDAFGLDVIFEAYKKEKSHTGRRYDVRIHNGALEILPWQRQVFLYVAEETIEDSSVTRTAKDNPATVWTGKGRIGKGKGARKVSYRLRRAEMIRKFGMKEKEKNYGRVTSEADLRRQVKADYAEEVKVKKGGSLTLTGMPFIRGAWGSLRKGEGIQIRLAPEGMTGEASWFWTTSVRHQISGGAYTVALEYEQEDPWLAYYDEVDKAKREKKSKGKKK